MTLPKGEYLLELQSAEQRTHSREVTEQAESGVIERLTYRRLYLVVHFSVLEFLNVDAPPPPQLADWVMPIAAPAAPYELPRFLDALLGKRPADALQAADQLLAGKFNGRRVRVDVVPFYRPHRDRPFEAPAFEILTWRWRKS